MELELHPSETLEQNLAIEVGGETEGPVASAGFMML